MVLFNWYSGPYLLQVRDVEIAFRGQKIHQFMGDRLTFANGIDIVRKCYIVHVRVCVRKCARGNRFRVKSKKKKKIRRNPNGYCIGKLPRKSNQMSRKQPWLCVNSCIYTHKYIYTFRNREGNVYYFELLNRH